jgi:hypothetical protein
MQRLCLSILVVLSACNSSEPPKTEGSIAPTVTATASAPTASASVAVTTTAASAATDTAPENTSGVANTPPPWGREDNVARGNMFDSQSGPRISIRQGMTTVNGRLPPEVIQRIVRQNFGRFKLCYQRGLEKNPTLAGTVATHFVIGRDGSVTKTEPDSSSTLTDADVTACIVRGFGNLSFPQPESGIVSVVFPIVFAPSN